MSRSQTSQVAWANEPSRCVSCTFSSLRCASYSDLQFMQVAFQVSYAGSEPRFVILIVPVLCRRLLDRVHPGEEQAEVAPRPPAEREQRQSASAHGFVPGLGEAPQD